MADLNGFNANEYEPTGNFEPLPEGKYLAMITDSQMKPTKRGDASYLELELSVLEGPYKDRKVWDRLCIDHPNDTTQSIARGNLSAICRAVDVLQPGDSSQLHNIPMIITVKCKKRADNDEISNEIRGYASVEQSQNNSSLQTASTPQTNNAAPPWQR